MANIEETQEGGEQIWPFVILKNVERRNWVKVC